MAFIGAELLSVEPGRVQIALPFRRGKRTHCATGVQTLMSLVGRDGVKG